jgi:hypothetical protein
MKQCEITTDQYVSIVKNLIKLNPNEYRNFDKTAEFILKSGLSNNEKSLSLFSISEIYIGLNELDSSFYELGNALKVADAKVMLSDPDKFVSAVDTLYNVKKSPALKVDVIEKKIEQLSKMKTITGKQLTTGVLTTIKNYFNTHEFESLEERAAVLTSITSELKSVINELDTTDSQKSFLLERIDSVIESLDKKSDFVSLRDIASFAELNNVIVTLKNGQMLEAISKPEGLFIMTQDGNEFQLDDVDILSSKSARNDDYSRSNTGKQEFFEDTILSNFKIKPIENTVYLKEDIENQLIKMGDNPSAGVRIFAVQLSGVGDDRIKRIQDLAVSNPKYKGLANRTYETFENETQINYLNSTSKGTVITVARPQKADGNFALMGKIIGTDKLFYLYPLDNYVFLNSDNTTVKIDFSNPVHLAKVKELSIKRLGNNTQTELTEDDLLNMKNAFEVYKNFKENLNAVVETQFSDDVTSIDVTEQFFSQYNLGSKVFGENQVYDLKDEVETNPSLSRKLTIATVDNAGNIIKQEERKVVFAFRKLSDKKNAAVQNQYQLQNTLNDNERIVVLNEVGEVDDTVTQQYYLDSYLKINDEYIKNEIFKGKGYETKNHIIIRFNNDNTYGFRVVQPVNIMNQMEGFATFITTLADVLTSPEKQSLLNNFNKDVYAFQYFSSKSGNIDLFVNFTSSMLVAGKSYLQIEVRPSNKNPESKYGFIETNKGFFNFPLAAEESRIIDFANVLRGNTDLVKNVVAENIIFSELDLNKPKDLAKFYSLLNELSKDSTPSENVTKLVKTIEDKQNKFGDLIAKKVIGGILENGKKFPGFLENYNADYPETEH